jgi:predicted nucleotidyltransferase
MYIREYISNYPDKFNSICEDHQVNSIYAFGSSVSDSFNDRESDIDLLVEIDEKDPLVKGELLLSLWDQLELFFERQVDLLTLNSLTNPFLKKNIDSTKELIYERPEQEVSV